VWHFNGFVFLLIVQIAAMCCSTGPSRHLNGNQTPEPEGGYSERNISKQHGRPFLFLTFANLKT